MERKHNITYDPEDYCVCFEFLRCSTDNCDRTIVEYNDGSYSAHSRGLPAKTMNSLADSDLSIYSLLSPRWAAIQSIH
jgi:hypothetical protein